MQEIDQRDRDLLGALQTEIPLVSTPFAVVGQRIDMSEKEVLKRTERLKRDGVIGQVGLLFDPRALGYRSCLVAARVPSERIDEAAAVINLYPGVTQNYRRNNDFNLWFTIAVAPTSQLGLERTIEILSDEAECEVSRSLPTLKQFKNSSENEDSQSDGDPQAVTPAEIESIRILQRDMPLQPRPFDALAKNGSVPADDLLGQARSMLKRGLIRRFAASVQTRKPGFTATAMGVWNVPDHRIDEVGATMSRNRAVSNCYLRPVYEDWPYNLYTVVHARSVDECESIINDLAADTGVEHRQALYPTREYRKARINLFSTEVDEWETARRPQQSATAS